MQLEQTCFGLKSGWEDICDTLNVPACQAMRYRLAREHKGDMYYQLTNKLCQRCY